MAEPFDLGRASRLALALLCAAISATCAATTRVAQPPSERSPEPGIPYAPAPVGATSGAPLGSVSPEPQDAAATGPSLPRFYAALAAARGVVRVAWLGDSHTLADFMPGEVRARLARRFGDAGPGFLQGTSDAYARAGARLEAHGSWRREPRSPARGQTQEDGVFGVVGTRFVAAPGARLVVELSGRVEPPLRWEVFFRLPASGDDMSIASGERRVRGRDVLAGNVIEHASLESDTARLELLARAGHPQLLGVAVEYGRAGVVVDNLGINGARTATPLAWDERAFAAHLQARAPALVVLAYGTNDVVSELAPERLREQYRTLLERVRRAVPDADCLLIGPPDLGRNGTSHPRAALIDELEAELASELGCGYFSMFQAMGGAGGMLAWMQQAPPLGAADGVHLTPAGYARIGGVLADALLAAFDRAR